MAGVGGPLSAAIRATSIGVAVACLGAASLLGCHAHHGSETGELDPSRREVELSESE